MLTGNVDTEQVAKEIAELSSLSTGDSKNVIDNLVTVMTRHLQSSESVTLDGLGTFRLTMKSTMNGVEDPLKVSDQPSSSDIRRFNRSGCRSGICPVKMEYRAKQHGRL